MCSEDRPVQRELDMCGRIVIATPVGSIVDYFEVHDPRVTAQPPRFNVAPSTPILLVRDSGDARILKPARWGLTPAWARSLDNGPRPINARAEPVRTSRLFKHAVAQRRCLLPADGFYEWPARGGRRKQPYYIHRTDGQLLALGGIWETWHEGAADALTSAAIITTPANHVISTLHERMPLVVEPGDWEAWLLGEVAAELLRPAAAAVRSWHAVDRAVGNIRHDAPHLIEPVGEAAA
jgi:putative SOS response-associated peptidase YedK